MSHNQSNYLQNYQNYYQSAPEQYDDYYEEENEELEENYDVPPDLQVPNSRLYTEGYPEDSEFYAENADFAESQQQVETTNMQYGPECNVAPTEYYCNELQPHYHHHSRVPKAQPPPLQSTSGYRYSLAHSLYPSCPLAPNKSYQGTTVTQATVLNPGKTLNQGTVLNQGENTYVPKVGANLFQGTGKNSQDIGASDLQGVGKNYYNTMQGYNDNLEMNESINQNQRKAYQGQQNYAEYEGNEKEVYHNQESYEQNKKKAYQTNKNYDENHRKAYQVQDGYLAFDHSQRSAYQNPENFGDYCITEARPGYIEQYGANQFVDYKGKKFSYCSAKVIGKSGNMKKYPVTVKTPKYVNKNQVDQPLHKRPSALCLPVVTQVDPGLVKRKSKTQHNIKKIHDQSEPLAQNPNDPVENYSYSAHQMHSEGDMNQKTIIQGLDSLLDHFETKMALNKKKGDGKEGEEINQNKIKEISKFLKPRVPPSIKARQEKIAKMKSSLNMSGVPLQPKMKLSLDKLLNRLQKCELSESGEQLSEKSSRSKKLDEKEKTTERKNVKHKSFNYENLTRKLSPRMEDLEEESKILLNKPSTSLSTSLDNKKSSRLLRPLDDHCAIDLHRSKSYIVDLIDRALSKELGTVARGQSIQHDMTPKRAVTTISRHRQSSHKELCYEVTAALTDSFISNATAPSKQHLVTQALKRCESEGNSAQKLCKSFSDDVDYMKQLKQLRWGHIRHIQHEARKLADLEEFLEKCGEIDY